MFEKEEIHVDMPEYFRLFGDDLKWRIMTILAKKPLCVQELTDELNATGEEITRSAVSKALGTLEEYRLVEYESEWRQHRYRVNKDLIHQVMRAGLALVDVA